MTATIHAAHLMDRTYRHQRHIYNFTRKYYLLGRDRSIKRLNPGVANNVLEIGCGTGRNLILAAKRYPNARFFGIDVSSKMLASANKAIASAGLSSQVLIAQADATAFNPAMLFGKAQFERVFISYSLSMIPDWRAVLNFAFLVLARDGEMHIVDFGGQEALPLCFRAGLRRWLARFAVIPCDELESELTALTARSNVALEIERPYKGYAQYAIVRRLG